MPLLQDLAIVMIIGSAMAFLCRRLGQPIVIGYLVSGLIIGPHTPPFALIKDQGTIRTMADLGLVFLMFSLGLEFSLPKLRKAGPAAAVSAAVVVAGMVGLGTLAGRLFGWAQGDSLLLGAMLAISGSSIIAKVFMDLRLTNQPFAHSVFGLMICDDIAAMVILSLLSGLGAQALVGPEAAAWAFLRVIFFVLLFLMLGLAVVPRLIRSVARYQSREATGILVLALCLGSAFLAARLQFSLALGAFLMGAIIAATPQISQIGEWVHPIRDMFSALFFTSAGMLVEPALLWTYKESVIAIVALTLLGRISLGVAGSLLTGHDLVSSLRIGASISQIGEFSFVIASLGISLGLAAEFLYPLAVATSSVTMFCTPFLIRFSEPAAVRLAGAAPWLDRAVGRYHGRLMALRSSRTTTPESAVLARYLIRLVAYLAATAGLLVLSSFADLWLPMGAGAEPWDWAVRAALLLASLPVWLLLAKYFNHLGMLLTTLWLSRPGLDWLFQRLNIRMIYNVSHAATLLVIGTVFAAVMSELPPERLLAAGTAVMLGSLLLAARLRPVLEWAEERLDEVLGLATSEPTRHAILMLGERHSLFYDLTEQVLLTDAAPAAGHAIRDLRLRSRTGASIAAIYRHGVHIMNPDPSTELKANDVLVLLGEEPQRDSARRLLLGSPG